MTSNETNTAKIKSITVPTGELLTYWRSDEGVCAVDVQFQEAADVVALSATAASFEDALLTLAARFKTLGIVMEHLADAAKDPYRGSAPPTSLKEGSIHGAPDTTLSPPTTI